MRVVLPKTTFTTLIRSFTRLKKILKEFQIKLNSMLKDYHVNFRDTFFVLNFMRAFFVVII